MIWLLFLINPAHLKGGLDWSNLDLLNYQYFKYQTTTSKPFVIQKNGFIYVLQAISLSPNPHEDKVNRAKAVFKTLREFVFKPQLKEKKPLPFIPGFAEYLSDSYQRYNGYRGQKLTEQLGNGVYRDLNENENFDDYF